MRLFKIETLKTIIKRLRLTRINLLLGLVILSPLTAISYSAAQAYLINSSCENARQTLYEASVALENYQVKYGSYKGAIDGVHFPDSSPADIRGHRYTISMDSNNRGDIYVLRATPGHPHYPKIILNQSGLGVVEGQATYSCP